MSAPHFVTITCRICKASGYVPDPYEGKPWPTLDDVRAAVVAIGWWVGGPRGAFTCPTCGRDNQDA